jgi:exodeoxyribonuclease III
VQGRIAFTLIAVWTVMPERNRLTYPEILLAGLDGCSHAMSQGPVVVAGDFNSNASYEPQRRPNHQEVVDRLTSLGLVSAYHAYHNEAHGRESRPTHLHSSGGLFHIDYCFVPSGWTQAICDVRIGERIGDHNPVVVDFDF